MALIPAPEGHPPQKKGHFVTPAGQVALWKRGLSLVMVAWDLLPCRAKQFFGGTHVKAMPLIQKYMTPMPHTIGADIALSTAREKMIQYGVRHLPVQSGGKLVGVLSDRDIQLAGSVFARDQKPLVGDVMTDSIYVVRPDAALDRVVMEMAEKKYGSALIEQENGKVVGIFTAIDGLRVLSDVLHQHYKGHD